MSCQQFSKTTRIRRPAREVLDWHFRPCALQRLLPPWERVEVEGRPEAISEGSRVTLKQHWGPFAFKWTVEHTDFDERTQFRDRQVEGPFARWEHWHRVLPDGPGACTLCDEIEYALPIGGALVGGTVRRRLERMFAYRHSVTAADLALAGQYGAVRKMRILVSGASGLVGSALIPFLLTQGHEVVRLVRRKPKGEGEVHWDPTKGEADHTKLRGIDAVIHLAGERVAGRWTESKRNEIWESRVKGTRTLVEMIGRSKHRPFAFICASAIGIYGDRGREILNENADRGSGFLADVCDAWEREAMAAEELGIRVALLRTGIVLTPAGGVLGALRPIFGLGLGGRLGAGGQWMSWISIDDLVGAYYHALLDQRCRGPVNAVAPEPVINAGFTATLGRTMGRPTPWWVPRAALRLALGTQAANEMVLASTRVHPERLCETGYVFRHERLSDALAHVLGRAKAEAPPPARVGETG